MNSPEELSEGDRRTTGDTDAGNASTENGAEKHDLTQSSRKLKLGAAVPLVFLAAGAAGVILYKNPPLREACRGVAIDSGVHKVCINALDMIRHEIAASWVRHNGPAALAGVFLQ